MLEKSTVTKQDIKIILADKYGIDKINNVIHLKSGSANCYRIQAAEGEFILKEFQSEYSVNDIEMEPTITEFVRERGIPAARFLPTLTGEYVWEFRGHAFHLQEFVYGVTFANNKAPYWLLQDSARILGRLHQILKDFPPLKEGFGSEWFDRWNVDRSRRQYADLIEVAERLPKSGKKERILADLYYKMEQISKAADIRIKPDKLTCRNSHGDYNILQFICGPSSVKALIDFSAACVLPVVWEIIRSYTYADPECINSQINISNLKSYVLLYLKSGGELTQYDLEMMPHLKHFQLLRSRYGYKEYLILNTENREQLINFGFWRTNICRWLEQHGEFLSQELSKLL